MCSPLIILWETDIALLYMHDLEIIVVVLTMKLRLDTKHRS